jgi:hypothetical protein
VLRAEQARITAEQAQVEQWAQSARHQVDDVMTALDEALLLVDEHQRAYDLATESQRRLLNLAVFEHFTIHEEADEVIIEPQLEGFYEQLMNCADTLRPTNGHAPESGRQTATAARPRPAALAAPTGARNRPLRGANPSPIAWGRGSHNEHLAEREGFEPSVDRKAHTRFPVVPVQPLRHLSRRPRLAASTRPVPPASGGTVSVPLRSARRRRAARGRVRRRPSGL